jgi:hypothetical protein
MLVALSVLCVIGRRHIHGLKTTAHRVSPSLSSSLVTSTGLFCGRWHTMMTHPSPKLKAGAFYFRDAAYDAEMVVKCEQSGDTGSLYWL